MILAAEREVYPDDLFDVELKPNDDCLWWLVHTKPRCEKAFARRMCSQDVGFYLPCRMTRKKVRGRIQQSYLPIFSGYAFVRTTEEKRAQVYVGDHVVKCSKVIDQELLWHDLRQVRKFLDLGVPVTIQDRLIPGQRVRLRTGPLAGMTGTILREAGMKRFLVEVNLIQRGMSVLLDKDALGLLDDEAAELNRQAQQDFEL